MKNGTITLVVFAVAVGAVMLGAMHYRVHLLWKYNAIRLGLQDVGSVPNRPMPDSPTPNGWVQCRIDCIELSLPPELACNRSAENGASLVSFQHGFRAVVVAAPRNASEASGLLATASELCPQSMRFTMPKLRLACYQASSDDFCWSMTPDEVRWHAFCITTSNLIRPTSKGHTETIFRRDLDGIAHFTGERVVFYWQAKGRTWESYVHFIDRGDNIDPAWIRAVCQSLKVTEGSTKEEHGAKPPSDAFVPPTRK